MSAQPPTILSVNISSGGIPKRPVPVGLVNPGGLAGDAHDHDKHNTPLQAICLMDQEDLDDLRAEGFDVGPGAMGENLTVRGLDTDALQPGDRLTLSGGVELEYTKVRKPCFVLDAIDPDLKKAVVGRLGGYARVITLGEVRAGETIEVQRWPHTGAVLAGGASRRMGSPKHTLALPDGRTMLDAVSGALSTVCRQVVVVGDPADAESIPDRRPGLGPLAGIEALLASGLDSEYLVCPCDVPRVTTALLRRLTAPTDAPVTVLRIDGNDVTQPLPARISDEALDTVRGYLDQGHRSVHGFLQSIETQVVSLPAAEARFLANVNRAEDLARLPRPAACKL